MTTKQLVRIIHEDAQITRPDQILVGRTYITRYRLNTDKILDVAENIITGVNISKGEFYTALSVNPKIRNIHSMTNYGIIHEENGNWNQANWLIIKNP